MAKIDMYKSEMKAQDLMLKNKDIKIKTITDEKRLVEGKLKKKSTQLDTLRMLYNVVNISNEKFKIEVEELKKKNIELTNISKDKESEYMKNMEARGKENKKIVEKSIILNRKIEELLTEKKIKESVIKTLTREIQNAENGDTEESFFEKDKESQQVLEINEKIKK
eukprot:UN31873